ncbi:MAG: glycosyltransferase [Candidatus Brocadiales bacterium]|nr:glycosyltransferase [Candidatus Brocadiales bacterium]
MNQKYGTNNPTLSLCMIVKDEEKSLPTCLESVKDYVDEIIVVDTGSTDRTVEIAKKYNAKVYHHAWENSFSKARNYSLRYATCDWILIMDADEEIEKKDAYKLRDTIRDDDVNLIYMPAFSKQKGGTNSSVYLIERVFKNYLDFHYEGIVHNALKFSGPCKNENIVFYHYGYHLDDEHMERKFTRTSTLLKEQINNDPSNPMPHHFLAIAFSDRNMNDECIDEALKAIRLFEHKNINTEVKLLTCYTASFAFFNKDDLVNAEYYAIKSVNSYSDYLDGYFILSSIYMRQKEYDKCIKATNKYLTILEKIISNPAGTLRIPYNNINNAWHAHTRLAIVCFEQNRDREGIKKLKETVSIAENKDGPYLSIAKYFTEQNNFTLAEKVLHIGLKEYPRSKRILYYISELYENHNIIEKALKYFKILLDIYPDEILAQYKTGLLHMKQSRYKAAIDVFKLLCSGPQEHIGALYNLGIAYEQIKDISHAKDAYDRLLTIEPENAETLVRLGSLFLNNSCLYNAKECFLKTIKLGKHLLEAHLALSRIYISQNDVQSCVASCDQILKCLNLPRDTTINNLSDLSRLYISIGKTLLKQQNEMLSGFSFDIAELLGPVVTESDDSQQDVVTVNGSSNEFRNPV